MKCPKCGQDKAPEEFYWRNDGRVRLSGGCRKCYPHPSEECQARFHQLAMEANRQSQDDANRSRQPWTTEQDEMLEAFWPEVDVPLLEIAAAVGRSLFSIRCRASKLDLPDRRKLRRRNLPQGENA